MVIREIFYQKENTFLQTRTVCQQSKLKKALNEILDHTV